MQGGAVNADNSPEEDKKKSKSKKKKMPSLYVTNGAGDLSPIKNGGSKKNKQVDHGFNPPAANNVNDISGISSVIHN